MLVVPSRWLANVRPGLPFRFAVDETGDYLRGSVTRIAPVVDPVAQTARVIGRLEDPGNRLMPGMSGSARFAAAGG
jgi:multidrug efflux pump subunit AcrA (membrane-fusion protein)